jgi:hypothetical protein
MISYIIKRITVPALFFSCFFAKKTYIRASEFGNPWCPKRPKHCGPSFFLRREKHAMKIAVIYNRESKNVINLFGLPNLEKYGKIAIKRIVDSLKKLHFH